ncbi:hypothetical protein VTO73DRAFT_12542 [Trametes versicolor]
MIHLCCCHLVGRSTGLCRQQQRSIPSIGAPLRCLSPSQVDTSGVALEHPTGHGMLDTSQSTIPDMCCTLLFI